MGGVAAGDTSIAGSMGRVKVVLFRLIKKYKKIAEGGASSRMERKSLSREVLEGSKGARRLDRETEVTA